VAGKNPREASLAIPLIYAPSEHNFNFNLDTGEIRDRQSRKNEKSRAKPASAARGIPFRHLPRANQASGIVTRQSAADLLEISP